MCVVFSSPFYFEKMVSEADDGCHAFHSLISVVYIFFSLRFGTHSYPSLLFILLIVQLNYHSVRRSLFQLVLLHLWFILLPLVLESQSAEELILNTIGTGERSAPEGPLYNF